jgi:hypothetical protein
MKKVWLVVLVLAAVCIFASVSFAGIGGIATAWKKIEISGYGPKETAVKGPMKIGLDQLADKVEKQIGDKEAKSEVFFNIEGLADQTGDGAKNDGYGKERADNASAYLSKYFPNAHTTSFSSGDSQNKRSVIVSYQIQWPTKISKKSESLMTEKQLLLIFLGIFAFVFSAVAVSVMVITKRHPGKCKKSSGPVETLIVENVETPIVETSKEAFWPSDLDELAEVVNSQRYSQDDKLCPFCRLRNVPVVVRWKNLKNHLTKCSSITDEQREELFKKIWQNAA